MLCAIENVNGIQFVMPLMLTDADDEFLCEYLRAYREFWITLVPFNYIRSFCWIEYFIEWLAN